MQQGRGELAGVEAALWVQRPALEMGVSRERRWSFSPALANGPRTTKRGPGARGQLVEGRKCTKEERRRCRGINEPEEVQTRTAKCRQSLRRNSQTVR